MILYEDFDKINWDNMPFTKKWANSLFEDKVDGPRGFLKIEAFEKDKKIYEFAEENQIMYWLKHAYSMLEAGIYFSTAGEHKGFSDGSDTQLSEADMPWEYILYSGNYIYSTHVWNNDLQKVAIDSDLVTGTKLYPFFPTKMRFGEDAPADITTPINPSEISLNDADAQGAGNTAGKLNFIFVSRTQHIALTTTGYDPTNPSGYYSDYGETFKNITVYQVTMPASVSNYDYDGKNLNEAGLFCDASLTATKNGLYDQNQGMILAKRYFDTIQKTNTISINFKWSIVK